LFSRKSTIEQKQDSPSIRSTLSATAPEYVWNRSSNIALSLPLPEDKQDILLFDSPDEFDYIENHLTEEIGYSIKLLISKTIYSEHKNSQKYFLNDYLYSNINSDYFL
jgi:hypothetical protein